ncbi:MAG: pyrroline-5-carboxylate reductase [Moraxellaceae bacterium]|nr:pyrroline-5-carboxylate reductase [Moraxellaceae bacterium]
MKITFLGGGNMASALIGGLIKQGFPASDLQVVEREPEGRNRLSSQFGVRCFGQLDGEALACDVLVLAVKPQQMREALAPLAGQLKQQLLLSVAAGLRLGDLAEWLGGYTRLVRSMPNTPALIGRGITGLYAHPDVDAAGRAAAEQVLAAVGKCEWVADESLMDTVTAVSGSGPAYVFRFIEALSAAGVAEGLPADVSQRLAIETFVGAALLAAGSPESPATLRERVTSKGGTTAAALESMNAAGIESLIAAAVKAARLRGAELGAELAGKSNGA